MKKIIGNTVGTPLPKPNLMQNDPKKGDYVKGKEEFQKQIINRATDDEVTEILDRIYGKTNEDIPEDDIPVTDDDFATDEEVMDMLDDIFGR